LRKNVIQKSLHQAATEHSKKKMKPEELTRDRYMSVGADHQHFTEGEITKVLANVIVSRVAANDDLLKSEPNLAFDRTFSGSKVPRISIEEYVSRIVHYLTGLAKFEINNDYDNHCHSDLAFRYIVMALILLDKLSLVDQVQINSTNIHRVLITAVMIASKLLDDIQPNNQYFAQLGGVSKPELNRYEAHFCSLLKFNLHVSQETFELYYQKILQTGEAIEHVNRHRTASSVSVAA